ncbi:MAG: peptide chain release factor N(5)-glutamine methyltransferase [Pseudomonadota bacterium]
MSATPPSEDELSRATARLREAGIENPAREARLISEIDGGAGFADLIDRRAGGVPYAHLTGSVGFYSIELICDDRALIPRADSETVVDIALSRMPEGIKLKVADLGTGSGCLLLAILNERPDAVGVGVEASPAAASLARENALRTGLSARAEIAETDWASWPDWPRMDLIVSNPPYIPTLDIEALQPEVRDHDPHTALDGGADGLNAYRSLIPRAGDKLKAGAWLIFEIGHDQAADVSALLAGAGFTEIETTQDLGGCDRVVSARWPG